jgi:hypothetical protein
MTNSFESISNLFWGSFKRKIISITFALALFFIGIWQVYPRVSCAVSGGRWIRDGILGQAQYCLRSYPDAGKACQSSNDCEGACILENYHSTSQPVPTAGVCAPDNKQFGCFDYLEYPNVLSVCAD